MDTPKGFYTSKSKILALIGFPVMFALCFAAYFFTTQAEQKLHTQTKSAVMNQLHSHKLEIESFFARYAMLSESFTYEPALLQWFENHTERGADLSNNQGYNRINAQFNHLSSNDNNVFSTFFASENTGEYFRENEITGVATDAQDQGYFANKRPWYLANLRTNGTLLGPVSTNPLNDGISAAMQTTVRNAKGTLVGVGGLDLNLSQVRDIVDAIVYPSNINNLGFAFLLEDNAKIVHFPTTPNLQNFKITAPDLDAYGDINTDDNGHPILKTTAVKFNHPIKDFDSHPTTSGFTELPERFKAQDSGFESVSFMGEDYYLAFEAVKLEVPEMNWTLGFMIPASAIKEPALQLTMQLIVSLFAVFALLICLIFLAPLSIKQT